MHRTLMRTTCAHMVEIQFSFGHHLRVTTSFAHHIVAAVNVSNNLVWHVLCQSVEKSEQSAGTVLVDRVI